MTDDVYFGDTARCRERQYADRPDGFVDLPGLSVSASSDRVRVAPVDDLPSPLFFFPAEYADALGTGQVNENLSGWEDLDGSETRARRLLSGEQLSVIFDG